MFAQLSEILTFCCPCVFMQLDEESQRMLRELSARVEGKAMHGEGDATSREGHQDVMPSARDGASTSRTTARSGVETKEAEGRFF